MDAEQQAGAKTGPSAAGAAAAVGGESSFSVRGISKQFGGTQALVRVGMDVDAGEIVALLGENGAGKSTLIKILAGVYALDEGTVTFRGRDVTSALRRLPIAFIHQDLGLIDWMTVAENICLTLGYPAPLRPDRLERGAQARGARRSRRSAPTSIPSTRIQTSAAPRSRWSRSPARWPPRPRSWCSTSRPRACPPTRWRGCSSALRRLRGRGVGMIYVSHRLDEVFEIADRMVVLRDGRVVGRARGRRDDARARRSCSSSAASRRRCSAGRRSARAPRGWCSRR